MDHGALGCERGLATGHKTVLFHKRNGNREVCYSQILEEAHNTPQEATWGGQGREPAGAGHTFFRGHGWSALGFPEQDGIGQFEPKEQGFVKVHGGLL